MCPLPPLYWLLWVGTLINRLGGILRTFSDPVPDQPARHPDLSGGMGSRERGAPAVKRALIGLRKARRCEGLQVLGDAQGVTATRPEKGKNMRLYDLWLIERILGEMDTAHPA
jgi:hypothetical protein